LQLFWLKTCSMSNMCQCRHVSVFDTDTMVTFKYLIVSSYYQCRVWCQCLLRCLQYLVNIHQCL
jgi:hypothetical protein